MRRPEDYVPVYVNSDARVLDDEDLKTMYRYMSIQMPMC